MEPDFDTYLSNRLAEYENRRGRAICECDMCGAELYEGQQCYYIFGKYCCDECIEDSKVELDFYYDDQDD